MTLYDTQRELEAEMRVMTIDRFHRLHTNAEKRGEFSETTTGRGIVNHLEQAMTDAVQEFVDQASTGGAGRRHLAVKMVEELGIEETAFLATKAIVNRVPMSRGGKDGGIGITVQRLAYAIAGMCHDELRLRYFSDNYRPLMRKLMEDFDKRDMPRKRRKEMIQRQFSRLQLDWMQEGWGDQNRLHLGVKLIELFRLATGTIYVQDVRAGTTRQRKVILPTPEMLEAVQKRMDHYEALFTVYLPMVVPPKKWENHNLFGGGYLTQNVTPYPLVKDSNSAYLEEIENSDLSKVLTAINALQDTKWRINGWMVDVMEWAYQHHGERVGFPSADPLPTPEKPFNADEDEDVSKEYRKQCYLVHDANRRAVSKRIMALQAFSIARKFEKYEAIYFPHNLDSRGRAYPKPVVVNPQGPDYVKSMLEFGEGKPVEAGSQAHYWLMIACANAWGQDKMSLQDRIDWVMENEEMVLSVGENPRTDHRWMDADEPFAALRLCKELFDHATAVSNGETFHSYVPVPVDATCSGLQHFSAMLRDEVGGQSVNLKAMDQRQDVYQEVADLVTEKLQDILVNGEPEERAKAQAALDAGVNRKMTKRSVMIVPYSGTFHACMEYIHEYYDDNNLTPWQPMSAFVPFVSKLVWSSISEVVVAARGAMDWLTQCAALAAKSEYPLPMIWTTPAGFPVRQVRYEFDQVRVRTFLDGKSCKLAYSRQTRRMDSARMRSSVAPNFVHSMDAAHLQLTVSLCEEAYATGEVTSQMSYAMVHDSFGVHAADMPIFSWMVRDAFFDMYNDNDVLQQFADSTKPVIDDVTEMPAVPAKGTLNLEEVLESEFFFS